jgi:hypothetical protein
VFTDTASGALAARPALDQVPDQLCPGDTLVVWKLDRLGRSCATWSTPSPPWPTGGIGFRSLQEAIDTTTPGGKLVFHIFAALAEFERDLIRERTSAGLAAARARGRTGGRPAVMTEPKIRLPGRCMPPGITPWPGSPARSGQPKRPSTAISATSKASPRLRVARRVGQDLSRRPVMLTGNLARR